VLISLRCENIFCIYQNNDRCILEDINLDIQGNCTDCIYVNLNNEFLEKIKKESKK